MGVSTKCKCLSVMCSIRLGLDRMPDSVKFRVLARLREAWGEMR